MPEFPRKKVIVPIDFSEESFRAVDVGLELVDDASHLHVIHVLQELTGEPELIRNALGHASRRDQAKRALSERLSDAKYKGVHFSVAMGDAGEEITRFAEQSEADLIVLPSHGRTGIKRLLIGSVAERVVRLAHCPVLVLRT